MCVLTSSLDIGASEFRPQVFTDQEAALMIAAKADANTLLAALMSTQACVAAQTPGRPVKSLIAAWRSSIESSRARIDPPLNETSTHWDDNMSVHSEDSSGSWETANTEDLCHSELDTDSNYWAQRHRQKQHRQRLQTYKKLQKLPWRSR